MDSSLHQAPPSMGFSRQEVLEWVAISFSRESSQPRDQTQVSHIVDRRFTLCSVSRTFRELQIKTMRKYCTTIKTAELKKKKMIPIDASVRNNRNYPSLLVKWIYSYFARHLGIFLQSYTNLTMENNMVVP